MRIPYSFLLYAFLGLLLALRIVYVIYGPYALAPDEAYFWQWSRHPDWSYYDMGPMVAWIIALMTRIFGPTELGVRIGAVILSTGVSIIVYYLAADMFGSGTVAFGAVFLTNIIPIGAAGSFIMTYYSPQVFFWSLSLFFLRRAISTGRPGWWYGLGLSLGCGFLSHHLFFILSAQIALYLLLSPAGRPWLIRKEPYLAGIIALDFFLPVLLWNIEHDMVMFRHASGLMTGDRSSLAVLLEFIGGQLGVISPFLCLAVFWAICVSAYRGIRLHDDRWLFLFLTSAPLLVFIGFLSLGSRVEANWPVSAYVSGTIAASTLFTLREKREAWPKFYAWLSVATALFVTSVGHFPSLLIPLYDLPPRLDTSNRLYGWRELGRRLSEIRKDMPWSFLASLDYGIASEIAFYTEGHPESYSPPVARRQSQYDFFGNINQQKGRDALYVSVNPSMEPEVLALFDRASPPEEFVVYKHMLPQPVVRRVFYLYRCYVFKGTGRAGLHTY